ncbi:MAG: hypothetical protein IT220_02450 [Flavobacteriaceae bacterium]|nr:hypothetical protein [Flavobacteriaceae bacterium]
MSYDPTIDYSQKGLSIDKNLAYWKFSELIKNLITLSSDAPRQIELIGYGAVADEMAIDFGTYYTLSYQSYIDFKLLTIDQKNELDELDKYLEDRSGDKSPDFWDDFKLDINPDWSCVRLKAKNILELLKMDDLSIDFDRTEKFDSSGNLTIQTTKTRLIKKNVS